MRCSADTTARVSAGFAQNQRDAHPSKNFSNPSPIPCSRLLAVLFPHLDSSRSFSRISTPRGPFPAQQPALAFHAFPPRNAQRASSLRVGLPYFSPTRENLASNSPLLTLTGTPTPIAAPTHSYSGSDSCSHCDHLYEYQLSLNLNLTPTLTLALTLKLQTETETETAREAETGSQSESPSQLESL